jgi:sigma-B regulation protein RsbU (phosphoserine phosphatase)
MPEIASTTTPLPDSDALFETAACALVVTDSRGVILKSNQTFCAWIGRDCAQIVGKMRLQDLLTMGGKIFHQTHWMPLLQMQGSVAEVKLEVVHADGRAIPMMMNAVSRRYEGAVFHEVALFVAEDRHRYEEELLRAKNRAEELLSRLHDGQRELRRAQTRLEIALSSADLIVWEADIGTDERRFDPGVTRLLGLRPGTAVTGADFRAAIIPEDRAREAAAFRAAQDSPAAHYEGVLRIAGRDGKQRTARVTGAKVLDESGNPVEFLGVLQDITNAVARRAAAEDRALFAEQMMGIVSHDLRNPLAAIHMAAHVLSRISTADMQVQMVGRIKNSVGRANRLIGDLLDFTQARIGRGLSVRLQALNLHELVAKSLAELKATYPDRRIEQIEDGFGPCIGDEDRLAQLLGNLVSNAATYGARDRPITVTSRLGGGFYSIEVHNEGTPIPAQILPSLFAPMERGLDVRNENKSVGLGLFIVKGIADALSGEVRAVSSAEDGTRFSLVVPTATE